MNSFARCGTVGLTLTASKDFISTFAQRLRQFKNGKVKWKHYTCVLILESANKHRVTNYLPTECFLLTAVTPYISILLSTSWATEGSFKADIETVIYWLDFSQIVIDHMKVQTWIDIQSSNRLPEKCILLRCDATLMQMGRNIPKQEHLPDPSNGGS